MPRNRVLSFMSQWSSHSPSDSNPNTPPKTTTNTTAQTTSNGRFVGPFDTTQASITRSESPAPQSPTRQSRARAESRGSRPLSMIQTYQPPQVEVALDTPPELQPIFSYLNSHSNKLYQEGYFLKLHDLDARGRPSADRTWVECFAQLVGTVLSLWDAAALDVAGVDGEVVPTFINLSDASLKMIESLPMSGAQGGKLQNVLSISTAANNRYLLHFNSLNSLTQWTAGIRLAMFEHATLQEAYTGSIIAGKGRLLNNIKEIMERSRFVHEDWARVRFGAGTPWRRLWFVLTPPDEKEYQKVQKMQKKGASYLRSQLPRGDIKFYESRKVTKKTKPIATINDVYAAYAIYPQSKPLIDQSTLVKMEGLVTIHSSPETTAEGFIFVMPEVHAAVSGFEMMLRWLFPVWDTFNIYGRPARLIADTLDQRGLMFAMPQDRRYGYLDILDVSGLIHENGSATWSERQWRKHLKKLTAERMNTQLEDGGIYGHRRSMAGSQSSLPIQTRQGVRFGDAASFHSNPSRSASPAPMTNSGNISPPKRVDSAPPTQRSSPHKRAASEAVGYKKYPAEPSRLSQEMVRNEDYAPTPPRHISPVRPGTAAPGILQRIESGVETPTMASLQAGLHPTTDPADVPPAPVSTPPAFTHNPGSKPAVQPAVAPELRRAHSAVDAATLHQMQDSVAPVGASEDDYGNLATNMVNPTIANHNLGGSYADRSQGPTSYLPILTASQREIPSQQRLKDDRHAVAQQGYGNVLQQPSSLQAGEITSRQAPIQQRSETILRQTPTQQGLETVPRQAHPLPAVPLQQSQRPTLPPTRSSQSITRKPIARKAIPSQGTSTPSSEHDSLHNVYIDNDALERVLQDDIRLNTMRSVDSAATPDYASTASGHSRATKKSIEKPRMGKLKTVGDPAVAHPEGGLDAYPTRQQETIPTIDFGPTYSLHPSGRPDTGRTLLQGNRSRSQSRDRLNGYFPNSNKSSPGENNRNSYFGAADNRGSLNEPSNRNSVAWTPGVATTPGSGALTPEQWVQYRAAVASQPQLAPRLAHSRQNSSSSRKLTKTPPPYGRNSSGDWSQLARDIPSRPNSRGAGSYLNQASPNGTRPVTPQTNLSAKEQTYVARATGTPLLDLSGGQQRQYENEPSNLLSAVAQREREKAAVKSGLRNGQVDEAIRARQQQQLQIQRENEAQKQQAMLAQRQHEQTAYQYQQNAYARSTMAQSAAASMYQPAQRQSMYDQPGQRQSFYAPTLMQRQSMYDARPASIYDDPQAQRLYEGQQQQGYMTQQGQAQMPRHR